LRKRVYGAIGRQSSRRGDEPVMALSETIHGLLVWRSQSHAETLAASNTGCDAWSGPPQR